MSKENNTVSGPVVPAMDLAAYTKVVIVTSGSIGFATFKRGTFHMVDAVTLKAIKDAGLVETAAK